MPLSDKYKKLLQQLLPTGKAWTREVGSFMELAIEGKAEELARIEGRALDLLEEVDPRTSFELLSDWERVVGLPDHCQKSVAEILEDRRHDVIRKLTIRGGSSRAFFELLAAQFNYTATVNDCFPFLAGRGRCGDRIFDPVLWRFWFQVKSEDFVVVYFLAGSSRCGERLRTFRNDVLECVIRDSAPAHTKVQFLYGS